MSTLALCIPAYNAEKFLPQLLSSAKNQIIPFDEILVYNDCSTDETAAVGRKYGAIIINGDENRGCSWGKNQLAALTRCEWIHFHDADDDLLPGFTESAHKWMSRIDCPDVVLFDYEYRDFDTNALLGIRKFNGEALKNSPVEYAISNQINPFCGLYNRKRFLAAGGYDIDPLILYFEDSAFHIKMSLAGLSFGAENTVSIINYRRTTSMSSGNYNKCLAAQYHVFEKAASATGRKYAYTIAKKLWQLVGQFAAVNNWVYVKKTLQLSRNLDYQYALEQSKPITLLSYLNPFLAVWLREKIIRLIKPNLRKN